MDDGNSDFFLLPETKNQRLTFGMSVFKKMDGLYIYMVCFCRFVYFMSIVRKFFQKNVGDGITG